MYIYKIVCKANNREYIGSTNNFNRRRKEHFDALFRGNHRNRQLQKDFIKYGTMAFHMEIIEEGFTHREIMIAREYIYINESKWKYNVILQDYSDIGTKKPKQIYKPKSLKKRLKEVVRKPKPKNLHKSTARVLSKREIEIRNNRIRNEREKTGDR